MAPALGADPTPTPMQPAASAATKTPAPSSIAPPSPPPPATSAAPSPPASSRAPTPKPTSAPVPDPDVKGKIEHDIIAGGWIPFVIVLAVAIFFAVSYVKFYEHPRERERGTTAIAIIGLVIALLTSAVIPVDVYLVSTFKDSDGLYHSWASEEIRDGISETVTFAYYGLYALILLFAFFLIPWGYFFFEEKDEDAGTPTAKRLLSSIKYALGLLIVMAILMCIGAFAIGTNGTECDTSIHESKKDVKCKAEYAEHALTNNGGTNAISFTIGFLALIGATYFILYTSVGLVLMPINLIRSRNKASKGERDDAQDALRASKMKQSAIRQKYKDRRKKMSARDRNTLAQEEEAERVINTATRRLDKAEGGMCTKLNQILTPFKFIFGIVFIILSLFFVISLTITSLDKLLQIASNKDLDYKKGYTQAEPRIKNPVDLAFTYMQLIFPIDYVFMTLAVFFFVSCTLAGVRYLGIRICGMHLYKIRPGRTTPQGILLLTSILMFVVLFLNVFLLSLSPQYVTYGNQHYPSLKAPDTKKGCEYVSEFPSKDLSICSAQAPQYIYYISERTNKTRKLQVANDALYNETILPGHCNPITITQCDGNGTKTIDLKDYFCHRVNPACTSTRMAALLHAFFYNLWFFGAIYYWANWGVILCFFVWFIVITCRRRRSIMQSLINDTQEDFDDSDDDMTPFNPSWRN